jgi:hypothetical protein
MHNRTVLAVLDGAMQAQARHEFVQRLEESRASTFSLQISHVG